MRINNCFESSLKCNNNLINMCVSPASTVSAHDESGAEAVTNKCGINTACGEPGMDGVHTC